MFRYIDNDLLIKGFLSLKNPQNNDSSSRTEGFLHAASRHNGTKSYKTAGSQHLCPTTRLYLVR